MQKLQACRAKLLGKQAARAGKQHRRGRRVLRVSQNRNARHLAVQPQLVRPAGHGGERENARDSVRFQNTVPAHGALSARVDDAEQAPVSDFVDRKRNFARTLLRAAIDGGQICFADLPVLHHLAELCVDMRVFGQQHLAERIPVEARHRMNAAGLVRFGVVAEQRVCERPVVFSGRRMDELPGGLIERDQALVLIENIDRKRLGEKSLGRSVVGKEFLGAFTKYKIQVEDKIFSASQLTACAEEIFPGEKAGIFILKECDLRQDF